MSQKLWNLAIIRHTTELVRGTGLFLVWCDRLICIVLSLCKHACKEVCDVKQGIDPYPLLAQSCDRWWPDFVTFTAWKRSIFGLRRGKKVQCVSNRCKDLFKRKKYFGVVGTLTGFKRLTYKWIIMIILDTFKAWRQSAGTAEPSWCGTWCSGQNFTVLTECPIKDNAVWEAGLGVDRTTQSGNRRTY